MHQCGWLSTFPEAHEGESWGPGKYWTIPGLPWQPTTKNLGGGGGGGGRESAGREAFEYTDTQGRSSKHSD